MSNSTTQAGIKFLLKDMMEKLDNPLQKIKGIEFLEKLDQVFSMEISEKDIMLIQNFFRSGYVKKILSQSILENKDSKGQLEAKIRDLEIKIQTLEAEKDSLIFDVKELKNKNTQLEEKIKKIENDNKKIENDNKQLHNKNIKLETSIQKLENDNKYFKKSISELMESNFYHNQEKLDDQSILNNVKERDNYKAIIYIILIYAGASFEEIYENMASTYKKKSGNINDSLDELYIDAKSYLQNGNNNAHNSSKINIFKKLFPNYFQKFGSVFRDDILNELKEIINDFNDIERKKKEKKEINERIKQFSKKIIGEFKKV